jgi:hypothetical protein
MSAVCAPERRGAPCRTARVAVIVASPQSPGALRRLLVGLWHPHVDVVVVTGGDGLGLRRAAGRDATVVSLPDATTPTGAAAVRAGAAVVIAARTDPEGAPAVVSILAAVATRRALLAGLTDRPNGAGNADWCDGLVDGPGRVERRPDVGYLGLGRAAPGHRRGTARRR